MEDTLSIYLIKRELLLAQSSDNISVDGSPASTKRSVENERILLEIRKVNERHLAELFAEFEKRWWMRYESARIRDERSEDELSTNSQSMMLMSSGPSQEEYDALIALYNATGGPNWKNKTGWSTADPDTIQDVSNWHGVDVDANGHVTSINLFFNGLTASIPTEVDDLIYLQSLNLSRNSLTGAIPSMANLTDLQLLELFGNQLTGGVPSWLGQLTSLEVLRLEQNPLGGSIPASLGTAANLKVLRLFDCQLTGNIPTELGNLADLEFLYLQSNQLSGQIPASLGNLTKLVTLWLSSNQLFGSIPPELGNCTLLEGLILGFNHLTGSIPPELGNLATLRSLSLGSNNLTGNIPPELGNLEKVETISLATNQLTGELPPALGELPNLWNFSVLSNRLYGEIPPELGNLPKLSVLFLGFNNFTGPIPPALSKLTKLASLWLSNNQFRGDISKAFRGSAASLTMVRIENNRFTISDFLDLKAAAPAASFAYSPQAAIPAVTTLEVVAGNNRTLSTNVDRNLSPPAKYQWFERVNGADNPLNPESDSSHIFILYDLIPADSGRQFFVRIRHDNVPGLTLVSQLLGISVIGNTNKTITVCLDYDSVGLPDWAGVIQRCMDNAEAERLQLIAYATDNLLEEKAGGFYLEQTTNCLANLNESFSYSYAPKEYHYTLYYYDQAGNLVQTVPPKGVDVVNGLHYYLTRYQYNSFDQLIWQRTPDAGESRFWYNDKTQLRLSQNAQQLQDLNYSYTKYDEQGRTTEVGEMNTTDDLQTLLPLLEDVDFPLSPAYNLSDIIRTFYDLPNVPIQGEFSQQFLRNRVSWVEVHEKDATGVIATYYSYDPHGNVKSLLQQIPGLENKRTDYVYDLVSGNVNYVMYQYDEPDQFIHRYQYDADNRITEVATSSDGYLWDVEARYRYYLHGPLARMELGQYRVQGLDYYYTLQGWLKGVNMPFASDPGNDGYSGVNLRAGRDVFSYSLGYFENDYLPSNGAVVVSDVRDNLWPGYQGVMGSTNTGLYNGNIAWMVTDLKKVGQEKASRAKGMQAMLYRYDQLHRIVQSRGLTSYSTSTGFGTPTSAYDEDFSYDANGNIVTLQRKDDAGTLADDFTYSYYPHTNKLRYHIPIVRDTLYSGAIASNNKVYRNITVQGTAFAPSGKDVLIKAIENIDIDQGFTVQSGATFRAYVLSNDEGAYNYDAIGNLIWDQDQGVRISWTPYGKVREVTKGDGTVVTFRYDGAGNRIEKKVVKGESTTITRYVRDAGENVMTVYNDTELLEQSIYGSSRLGLYHAGAINAQRTLGFKSYELSNHLGNVLSVITDNIRMTPDSTWAAVVSAGDYYAFGSGMPGRDFEDDVYRYGFNGKEKDKSEEFGITMYNYGFRVYHPAIGKFLSVDPLTKSYPMLTPYQFASNRPIDGIDLDGLEYVRRVHIVAGNGTVVHTEDYIYYQMGERELELHGGTSAGIYNAGAYGPQGEGIQHQYINASGELLSERWDLPRNNLIENATSHGLYSGGGSITNEEGGYDFSWRPIDIADAIAKAHDMEYASEASEGYQGYVEDIRTLAADRRMLERIEAVGDGATAEDLGLEAPLRNDIAGETRAALMGQKRLIGMLSEYKAWKNAQQDNGAGISILNENDANNFINAAGGWLQRRRRALITVPTLREAETQRLANQNE